MQQRFVIRPVHSGDVAFLWHMLYEAAYWHPEVQRPLEADMRADDQLARYVSGWGRFGDMGVIAEDTGVQPIGAAWLRLFSIERPGYGFLDEFTPEVSIAVRDYSRGRGIGTALLTELLELADETGIPAVSLSVSGNNPALRLYERYGFVKVKLVEGSWTMRRGGYGAT